MSVVDVIVVVVFFVVIVVVVVVVSVVGGRDQLKVSHPDLKRRQEIG